MIRMREGAGGCESRVVCGRSPMFARCWFTAARAGLVIVSTDWCVMGGEKYSFKRVGPRGACDSNAGVCVGSRRGEATRHTVRLRAIRGGNGGPIPSFGSGAW